MISAEFQLEIADRNRLLARPISLAEIEIGCWPLRPRFLSPRLALYITRVGCGRDNVRSGYRSSWSDPGVLESSNQSPAVLVSSNQDITYHISGDPPLRFRVTVAVVKPYDCWTLLTGKWYRLEWVSISHTV